MSPVIFSTLYGPMLIKIFKAIIYVLQ